MRVADLKGALLDFWVARAEGFHRAVIEKHAIMNPEPLPSMCCWLVPEGKWLPDFSKPPYRPSTDWSQGSPIMDREKIKVTPWNEPADIKDHWRATTFSSSAEGMDSSKAWYGETALIAAMRAYVALKFGEEVPDSAL